MSVPIFQNIVYIDLEDFVLLDICNKGVDNAMNYLKSIGCDFTKRVFLFIDEVQYLDNPSSFLKLFHDRYGTEVKLVVSGSSSFAIKSKFKDSLVGRMFGFELFGLARETIDNYLFILENTYIIKQIPPFSRNIRIELTKMPEVFLEDTGMMNLLNHKTFNREITGSIFETSIFSLLRKNVSVENIFYWRTSKGHEIDFIYEPKSGELNALEIKLRFRKQRLTAIDYFRNEYSTAKAFLVTLEKLAGPVEGLDIVYPWELYGKLFVNG